MVKSSSNNSNKSAEMELTSSEGQSFIEVIYLNPQSAEVSSKLYGEENCIFWRCMPVHSFTSALSGTN